MQTLKNYLRLIIGILAYELVGAVFIIGGYIGKGNEQDAVTNFVLVMATALIAYRFALKLIEMLWSDSDSILAQTFKGGRSTFADRICWDVAIFIYFGYNLISRHFNGTNTGFSTACEIILMVLVVSHMLTIYLKIKAREDGTDVPVMEEED